MNNERQIGGSIEINGLWIAAFIIMVGLICVGNSIDRLADAYRQAHGVATTQTGDSV